MTDYPNITFLDSDQDVGPMKSSWFAPIRLFALETLGGSAEVSQTIASGAITPANGESRAIKLAGEGAADDVLDNITLTNVPDGALLMLRSNGTDEITLTDAAGGSGQMLLRDSVDYMLDTDAKRLILQRVGTNVLELWRSHPKLPEPGTETATTSGTSISLGTSISPNARQIIAWCRGVSSDGADTFVIQFGDPTIETTGYADNEGIEKNGFILGNTAGAAAIMNGQKTITLIDRVTNRWMDDEGTVAEFDAAVSALSIATQDGVGIFDAGNAGFMVLE